MKKSVTRLFSQFQPKHYELLIKLYPDKKTFEGSVIITGKKTGRPSRRITFHQKDLRITDAGIRRADKNNEKIHTVSRINRHTRFDEVRLHTEEILYPGEYVVILNFNGKITDPMNGLYPCYFTHDGEDKFLLATQFESHHAREVFPCIDEPEAKATFSLTIGAPDQGTVLSNTPIANTHAGEHKWRVTEFEKTPIMSTYLLAFVYGEIDCLKAETKNGTLVRTYATPDKVDQTKFALDTAVKCLEFYEDYFDIPYPLAKQDMIALPDFASGAMENWGLITYREQALLVDPKNTSLQVKQWVAMVVAHELAHQWFGNLVTMRWWTDLWLNEGFASWIEYLAVDKLFPDWDMWTQFIVSEQQTALKLDALDNTHPIEVPINHPDEIRSIFDAISYQKGASVIHMLHGYLGEKDFRDGLRYYLKQNAYGNAETKDLWAALEKVSDKPVREFMQAWTSLPGFPLITVSRNDKETTLQQERFYVKKPAKISRKIWPVPVLGPLESPERLTTTSASYHHTGQASKINRGQSGFYRVDYSPELSEEISGNIQKLEPLDRLGLLADAFEVSKAGYSSVVEVLKMLEKYADEDNAAVWDIIAGNIGELRRVMDDEKTREMLKPLIANLTKKQRQRLGWNEKKADSHFDRLLRPTVLGLAAGADVPEVVEECLQRFADARHSHDIPADLRSVVFNTAARKGNAETHKKLLAFYNDSNNSEEKVVLAAALTSFEDIRLIEKSLGLIKTKAVRRQDAMYWVAYSFMNRHAKRRTWQWMKDSWPWLDKELGSDLSFYRTPIYAARSFSDEDFLEEYDKFFKSKMSPALERSIKQGREMLEWQIAWKKRDLKPLLDFLSK